MKIKHLDHLNINVRDFKQTAEWYGRVFGFEIVEEGTMEGEPWGVLRSGEALLCVYQSPDIDVTTPQGINHFGLRIANREEWEATVAREKVKVRYGGAYPYRNSTAWYVVDPTGYEIEVALWNDDKVTF